MATHSNQVSTAGDDARSNSSGGSYNNNQTTYYVGIKAGIDFWIGHRFQNVVIPQGATINSATLDVYDSGIGEGTTIEMSIRGHDADDVAAWSSPFAPGDITPTTARTDVTITLATFESGGIGFGKGLWDVAAIIEEIVGRAGWVSGNDLSLVMHDNGSSAANNISMSTYDRDTARGAKLEVDYTEGGGGATRRVLLFS